MLTRRTWVVWAVLVLMAWGCGEVERAFSQESSSSGESASAGTAWDHFLQAYRLTRQGELTLERLDRIIQLCRRGLQLPGTAEQKRYGRRLLAWAYNRRGQWYAQAQPPQEDKALADFEQAVQLDPTRWKYFHNRGVSFAKRGQWNKALADFDQVLRLHPPREARAKCHFNRGEVFFALGRYEQAVQEYTQALRLQPPRAQVLNARGAAWVLLGQAERALQDLEQAIALEPNLYDARVNRGNALAELGRYGEAVREFRVALKLEPDRAAAYASLAWLLATCQQPQWRDPKQALAYAQRAVKLGGEEPQFLTVLAAAWARSGKPQQAAQLQRQALLLAQKRKLPQSVLNRYRRYLQAYQSGQPWPPQENADGKSSAGSAESSKER